MTNWQPIETAPKDGQRVMLFFPFKSGGRIRLGGWRGGKWMVGESGARGKRPTHWMPLPKDPV